MEFPGTFPFSRLTLPGGEQVLLQANNPTFHRTSDYGIVVTDQALYLFSPFWLFLSKWKRYPRAEIRRVLFKDSSIFPSLLIELGDRTIRFRTPPDHYKDEMEYDRQNLKRVVALFHEAGVGV